MERLRFIGKVLVQLHTLRPWLLRNLKHRGLLLQAGQAVDMLRDRATQFSAVKIAIGGVDMFRLSAEVNVFLLGGNLYIALLTVYMLLFSASKHPGLHRLPLRSIEALVGMLVADDLRPGTDQYLVYNISRALIVGVLIAPICVDMENQFLLPADQQLRDLITLVRVAVARLPFLLMAVQLLRPLIAAVRMRVALVLLLTGKDSLLRVAGVGMDVVPALLLLADKDLLLRVAGAGMDMPLAPLLGTGEHFFLGIAGVDMLMALALPLAAVQHPLGFRRMADAGVAVAGPNHIPLLVQNVVAFRLSTGQHIYRLFNA